MEMSASRFRPVRAVVLAAASLAFAGLAHAGPVVNIVTGLSLSMQPAATGSLTLQFTNTGDASQGVNTYTLGIMLVQTSGIGTLTFDSWAKPGAPLLIGDEAAEYMPVDPPSLATLNAPITLGEIDYDAYYPVQVAASVSINYLLAAGATTNVGLMTFTNDGVGTWDVYAVNQAPQGVGTKPVSLLQTADATAYGFGNLPATDGSAVKIGEITVVSVVPEPSTAALAGVAVVACCVPGLRRRIAAAASRRRAAAATAGR